MTIDNRPTIMLIGSGYKQFRGYLLEGVSTQHRVLLLNFGPVTWQWPYIEDARVVEPGNEEAVLTAATSLAAGQDVSGVMTWDEGALELVPRVAHHLRVPAPDAEALGICRNKAMQRERFAAAGVPSPAAIRADSLRSAIQAAEELGYPVVVKPVSLAGSIGVRIVQNPQELEAAFTAAESAHFPGLGGAGGVLVEEFLEGEEVSVDCWALDGEIEPFVTARKTVGFPPYFEEIRHVVGGVLPDEPHIHDIARTAVAALGLDRVVAHTELMITKSGPKIIEVNGRLGGDLIPYLGELAGGPSAGHVAATVATGQHPVWAAKQSAWAGVEFLYPQQDMVLSGLTVEPAVEAAPWLNRLEQLYPAGSTLLLPPRGFLARAGCAIVTATDEVSLTERLDLVARSVTPSGTPLPEDDSTSS